MTAPIAANQPVATGRYDAAYIALAEATDSVLYTTDEKLRRGHRAQVVLFTS